MKMNGDSGSLSIDFLVGFTIFILAFIWVISMIPGLLINLQGFTIDYDAVAYRTGVILAEDPGEPSLPTSINPWENLVSSAGVVRFGLALSKDDPNILSQRKVNRFFCLSDFSYPVDYQNRTIFGDYPYTFNISLIEPGSTNPPLYIGDNLPATSSYGTMRRLVKIKGPSTAIINGSYNGTTNPDFFDGENETMHEFSILINNTKLLHTDVLDPAYQIDPSKDTVQINITNLNETMQFDRKDCFDIRLSNIIVRNKQFIKLDPVPAYSSIIDGMPYNDSSTLQKNITNNISLILDPPTYWSGIEQIYINLTFNLIPKTPIENPACYTPIVGIFSRSDPVRGSRFLNNTFKSPFKYDYSSKNVIQPQLRDAVLEIKVGSGVRTVTEIVIKGLDALFKYDVTSGAPNIIVQFTDQSTGNPVEWDWNFGDGSPHGITNNPAHTYATPGIKTVTLIVKDATGASKSITKTVDLSAPVAAFSGLPVSGTSPLDVHFTDTSTGGLPTTWKWEYNKTVAGSWTQFSTSQNPLNTFTNGTYDIRLTVTNLFGSSNLTKPSYIMAIPPAPVASFNTTPSPATGNAPLVVMFTDTSTGGTPTSWDWDFGDGSPHSNVQNPPAHTYSVSGSYTAKLTVSNAGGSSNATKPISVGVAPPIITTITPNNGLNTTSISITNLAGANFLAGATVKLNRTGYTDIAGTSVTVVSPTQITCTFDLTNRVAGQWNVAVTNPDGQSTVLVNGFTIKSHHIDTYTSSTTWTVPSGVNSIDYLVVAGGGGGGSYGGGGGAGGLMTGTGYSVTPGNSIIVTIGGGGAGGSGGNRGTTGSNSVLAASTTITAFGGGGGGSSTTNNGRNGGSGGGGARQAGTGGTGTAGQGNSGAAGRGAASPYYGGGGGGASAPGTSGSGTTAGSGGAGTASSISGASITYCGGGGGGSTSGTAGSGGLGGGGNGAVGNNAGSAATYYGGGGGGGGSSPNNGGAGYQGIVIIAYDR